MISEWKSGYYCNLVERPVLQLERLREEVREACREIRKELTTQGTIEDAVSRLEEVVS